MRNLPRLLAVLFGLLLASHARSQDAAPGRFVVEPSVVLDGIPFGVTITAVDANGQRDRLFAGTATLTIQTAAGTETRDVAFEAAAEGRVELDRAIELAPGATATLTVAAAGRTGEATPRVLPGYVSIIPALLAIVLAILFRQVVFALALGILAGAAFLNGYDPIRTLLSLPDTYLLRGVTGVTTYGDPDTAHAKIIIFSLLLGGMVGVISRAGGTHGIVDWLTRFARNKRSGQLATATLGTAVFFDDYANCLIVGNTMRPLTDRLRISREKLSYIVDSTAAPVASLMPLSTWVGYQVGLVADAVKGLPDVSGSAYSLILQAIPYMFYPIFALALVFLTGWLGRDLFTMLSAERRANEQGKVIADRAQPLAGGEEDAAMAPKEGAPRRALNALLPILSVVVVTILGLVVTGSQKAALGGGFFADVKSVIEEADSYAALLWASVTGAFVAIVLSIVQRILSPAETMDACVAGMKAMFLAIVILVLSWSLGDVTGELHASNFLASQLGDAVQPMWLPLIVFALGSITAFATGSSWGTMGILIPLVVPLAHGLGVAAGLPADEVHSILLGSIASVLGGAVFGDHCSPISDTTVLSSMASSCDHIDHVRTQMPYAILAALFAAGAGYLPEAYGYPAYVSLPIGLLAMFLFVRFVARPVERERGEPSRPATEAAKAEEPPTR